MGRSSSEFGQKKRVPQWHPFPFSNATASLVQVGNYKTKLEADKDAMQFQKKVSGIIVVPMGKN